MIRLRVEPGWEAAQALTEIKMLSAVFPGDERLQLLVEDRTITIGAEFGYRSSPMLIARLEEFGTIEATS